MISLRLLLASCLIHAGFLWDAFPRHPDAQFYVSAALADDDDDGGDDDDNDSDDDDGGSAGGGAGGRTSSVSTSSGASDDDDNGSGGGRRDSSDDDGPASTGSSRDSDDDHDDNDDNDDIGGGTPEESQSRSGAVPANPDAPRVSRPRDRVGEPLRRQVMPRSETDRARGAEISAANLTEADLARLRQLGFQVIRQRQVAFFGNTLALRLRTPRQFSPEAAIQIARQTVPGGVFDFSHLYNPSQGSPIYAWNLVGISASQSCGRGARIGMIDTEVARHPALARARVTRRSFSEGRSDPRHGTAVASLLVGADPSGQAVFDRTDLFAASVFFRGRESLDADAIDIVGAIDWLVHNQIAVVNISIAGPANTLLEAAVAEAARRGTILVAAAGNNSAGGRPRYPAAYPAVIAVSAVDQRLRPYAFNTRGNYIDIAAPGVDVWAANADGGGALWSGTSFAAPFVAVELAIAAQNGLVLSPQDARNFLARNARDIGAAGRDPVFGAGLLQSVGC